ncbi:MAG TPA: HAMP domain-containing sensor histidine kinase [Solirubrobacteraceae bacterium]|nr:HAMP domain-containing sensor histidine kinase [Solirubrobacteraceae bacterium]
MPLRRRLSIIAASSVAIAVVIVVAVSYLLVRDQLLTQIDGALQAQAQAVQNGDVRALTGPLPGLPASRGGSAQYFQIVQTDGQVVRHGGDLQLPVAPGAVAIADGRARTQLTDVHVSGAHLRQITFPLTVVPQGPGGPQIQVAVELARPLNGVDGILSSLRLVLFLVALAGVALAALLGRLAARRVIRPLSEVASAAQHIGETDDLSQRLRVHADDEVGQLATRFNAMLDRLEASRAELDESVRAQRQLVADASHELRTPVTSLRTNIEVLLMDAELDREDRRRLLSDVVEQSEELSALVSDLIELARGDQPGFATEDVRLDRIAEECVARARRNTPGISVHAQLTPVTIDGVPARLSRAINNLLDNAARHSPSGATVELTVDTSGVTVRDHGPGVVPADLPYVFDRFFRGSNSRGRQGSGLGLAIVRQVTQQHGGTATVANAPDGGAVFTLHLPVTSADPARPGADHGPEPGPAGEHPAAADGEHPAAAGDDPAAVRASTLQAPPERPLEAGRKRP